MYVQISHFVPARHYRRDVPCFCRWGISPSLMPCWKCEPIPSPITRPIKSRQQYPALPRYFPSYVSVSHDAPSVTGGQAAPQYISHNFHAYASSSEESACSVEPGSGRTAPMCAHVAEDEPLLSCLTAANYHHLTLDERRRVRATWRVRVVHLMMGPLQGLRREGNNIKGDK